MERLKTLRQRRVPNAVAIAAVALLALGAGLRFAPGGTPESEPRAGTMEPGATEAQVASPDDGDPPATLRRARLLLFRRG